MFIKFGDKTKPIEVKKSGSSVDDNKKCIYLDEDGDDNRRIDIIRKHISEDNEQEEELSSDS
tara:strand:- start:43 stop:228 length:186 start_codon:yes stop_codon:yes gene_type:complete